MRIGICGYATAGKDVVADLLVEQYGFVKVNMSDALDRYYRIINPLYDEMREHVDYVTAKRIPWVRTALQRLGTDVGRDMDPDIWVKVLEREAGKYEHVVTTGIRFAEECVPLDMLVHVERQGVGPINDHPSENLDLIFSQADIHLDNNGTIENLQGKALWALNSTLKRVLG